MQLRSFLYFEELAEAGSFYAAAKNLLISQQGLSKVITSLEDELGLVLVERSSKGIRLTSDGETVLKYAQEMTTLYDSMIADLYSENEQRSRSNDRIMVYVSYYSAQIAAIDSSYVRMLSSDSYYIEEPYEKLIKRATSSDGAELVFADIHPYSREDVDGSPDLAFDKVFSTRYGLVWKEGFPFSNQKLLHRADVAGLPMAVNTFRESARFTGWLFEETPLRDIRMGATSPHMLLEYVRNSEDAVAIFDSFSFFLAQKYQPATVEGLRFTPFSTSKSICDVGFLHPKGKRLSTRARYSVRVFKHYIKAGCKEYFDLYPL